MPNSNAANLDYNDLVNIHELVQGSFGISAGVHDASLVHAVANRPNQMFYRNIPFPDIFTKAASIMEAIIRWHPFVDANKRTALAAVSCYLYINRYSFIIPLSAVRFSVEIARADTTTPEGRESQEKISELVKRIAKWLRTYSSPIGTRIVLFKQYLYVNLPARLLTLAFRIGLESRATEILAKWLAWDIYPDYMEDSRKIVEFLNTLRGANLPA